MSETRNILEDSVTRLFTDLATRDLLASSEETGWAPELWDSAVEQGLTHVMASEDHGGMGGDWRDAFVVIRACGRFAVPLPLPEQILVHWLAAQARLELPDGIGTLLPTPMPPDALTGGSVTAHVEGVPWGRQADYFVGLATKEAHTDVVVVGAQHARCANRENLAREPRDTLGFDGSPILARGRADLPHDAVHWLGAAMRSAQIAGADETILQTGIDYTSDRVQFGRPLAKFQAIQHYLAEMAGMTAAVDAIAVAAFEQLDQRGLGRADRDARFEIAAAKCQASEAVETITRLGHQVHGAIGFTFEYGLHFHTRRLWSWRTEFGSARQWSRHLGALALETGGDELWALITG